MQALLRLQAAVLFRTLIRRAGVMLLPVSLSVLLIGSGWKQEKRESIETLAIFAGGLACILLLAWGFTCWSLEATFRCSPAGPRRRALSAAAFAALLSLPLGLFCLWIPGLASSFPDDSGVPLAMAALQALLWGAFGIGSAAILFRDGILVVRVVALLASLAAAPIAVGLHVVYGVPGPSLGFHLLGILVLGALFRRLESAQETRPAGSTMIGAAERGAAPTPPPAAFLTLEPAVSGRPELVLLRWLFTRWYWWGYVALGLGLGIVGGLTLSSMALLFLYIGAAFPVNAWTGFQASPLARKRAFLALYSPLFALWLLIFGLQAVLGVASRDVRYLTQEEGETYHGQGMVSHVSARLRVPDGWTSWYNVRERIPQWPSNGTLPVDVAQASRILSGLFREGLSLSVAPEAIEALHPDPRAVPESRRYDPGRRAWIEAIAARFDSDIDRRSIWQAILNPLLLLVLTLLMGLSYFPRAWRSRIPAVLCGMLSIFCLLGYFVVQRMPRGIDGPIHGVRAAALDSPLASFVVLSLGALALGVGYYRLFRRMELPATKPGASF